MIVQCPSCGSRYRVNDANVPASGGKITCPSCQHKFIVYPEEQAPVQGGGASDDLEDKTSVAFRPDLQQLVSQMQQGGGAGAAGEEAGQATEVMSGDSIPDFLNSRGGNLADDGTVEMKNPFGDAGPEDVAATEVVSGDMLGNLGLDAGSTGQAAQPSVPASQPAQPAQPSVPPSQPTQSSQSQPAQPAQPSVPPSQPAQPAQTSAPAAQPAQPPAGGPNPEHDGPWKLKTNFGLTYEFPDTKSLKNWLSNREDLDGYELSGDGDTFHALDAWPQIGSAASTSQQIPSYAPANAGAAAASQGAGAQRGPAAAGMPGGPLTPQAPPASPSANLPKSAPAAGKKIKPQEFRPPSRDAQNSGLLWGIFVVLFLVAAGLAVQLTGIYDLKGLVLGKQPAQQAQTQPQTQPAAAQQGGDKGASEKAPDGPDPKITKEVDRLLRDAQRAMNNNRLQSASEKLKNAKLLQPKRAEVYEMLSEVYAKMGQQEESDAAKKKAAELKAGQGGGDDKAGKEASNN